MTNFHNMMANIDLGREKGPLRLDEVLADMDKRLRMLEIGGTNISKGDFSVQNAKNDEGSKAWQPTHMIIGGWDTETDRETVEHECELMMRQMPNIANDCQRGYAPRTYGSTGRQGTQRLRHAHH